jgi:ketosteroid isomerase-like protein
MSTLKDRALEYFTAFSNKDLDTLASMFDDHITLRDWEMSAAGKTLVLGANKHIFDSVEIITVTPLKLYQDDNTVTAEISIDVYDNDGETTVLKVVDVIEFVGDKIRSVRAYKG